MYSQNAAARYRNVRSHGLIAEASPTRLIQIMFEHVLSHLATTHGSMTRIRDNRPVNDVVAKGAALGKAIGLIDQLNACLDMQRGGEIAGNLRALYLYMMQRLTLANATNDAQIVVEVVGLVQDIKAGWDQIVTDAR
jgi:flagellar protein FliS